MKRPFKVRDFRQKRFFIIDDAYLNGYAKLFTPTITAVYLSLCRHADKQQSTFPSQDLIADEHGLTARTVRRAIDTLKTCKLISVERERTTTGKWLRNTYYLLDKSEWLTHDEVRQATGHPRPMDNKKLSTISQKEPEDICDTPIGHPRPIKDTHLEVNTLNTYRGASAPGIKAIGDLLKDRVIHKETTKKTGGATYEWQDRAVRLWQKLGIKGKPGSNWFKIFKLNAGLAERAVGYVGDSGSNDPEKLVYWAFNQFKTYGRINFDTAGKAQKQGLNHSPTPLPHPEKPPISRLRGATPPGVGESRGVLR